MLSGGDASSVATRRERAAAIDAPTARALVAPFRRSKTLILVLDPELRVLATSGPLGALEPVACEGRLLESLVHPSNAASVRAALLAAREGGSTKRLDVSVHGVAGSCSYQLDVSVLDDAAGLVVLAADITDRKETEERLRRAEALMVDTEGTAHFGTWEWDVSQPNATWSDELYRIYGLVPGEYTPSYEAYLQMVHPDDRAHVMAATERVFREHRPYSHDERIILRDGSLKYLHTWAHAIVDADGKLTRLIGVCQDITDRKRAELALEQRAAELSKSNERLRREMHEREVMEKQLRQVQKLDALGRLAGGIAHDFNNLMGVVIGYSSMMHSRMSADDPLQRYLVEIMKSGDSAARLTRQLLAFSREQVIARGPIDPNAVVGDLTDMLQQLIGETIDLKLSLETDLGFVDANRSQLDQVVVNLVVNARDAMPDGGEIVLQTDRRAVDLDAATQLGLEPGRYVCIVVRDEGVGMDEELQSRIFDPFFTTKGDGKGTGLGLSTVFGIVKQSGGGVSVRSALGRGAEFTVWLPEVDPDVIASCGTLPCGRPPRGTETVLVVEDQGSLRSVIRESLEACGYHVIDAMDASEALQRADAHGGAIDLLLTDVVMPKTSGRELAERLLAQRPSLRVLFMSGYADDVALRDSVVQGDVMFLAKPFTPTELAERVRSVLDGA
jgi:PAS domain S-box-containing protein